MSGHNIIRPANWADRGSGADVIQAIRNDQPIADAKLKALRNATAVVDRRGWLLDDDVAALLSAGDTHGQILEIIPVASLKTLSNYARAVAERPIDMFANRVLQSLKKPAA